MRNDWSAPGLVTALAACAVVAGSLASAQSPGQSLGQSLGMPGRLLEVLRLRGESAYHLALRDAKQLASEHADLDTVHRAVVDLYLLLDDVDGARSYFEERSKPIREMPTRITDWGGSIFTRATSTERSRN